MQRHLHPRRAAVLHRVLQRFLQNAIEAESNLLRQMRDLTEHLKADLDTAPLGHLTTKAPGRRLQAHHELRRVQPSRQTLNVACERRACLDRSSEFLCDLAVWRFYPLPCGLEIEQKERQPLTDVVVEFARDTGTFLFLGFNQPLAER